MCTYWSPAMIEYGQYEVFRAHATMALAKLSRCPRRGPRRFPRTFIMTQSYGASSATTPATGTSGGTSRASMGSSRGGQSLFGELLHLPGKLFRRDIPLTAWLHKER